MLIAITFITKCVRTKEDNNLHDKHAVSIKNKAGTKVQSIKKDSMCLTHEELTVKKYVLIRNVCSIRNSTN